MNQPAANLPERNVTKDSARLPSLDGWRALSIVMVLGGHSQRVDGFPEQFKKPAGWIFDGDLGVRFFFVISGFLITYLLLREHEKTKRVDLGRFYARRALRILPVYFAFLFVMLLFQMLTTWHQTGLTWLANLTFTSNFLPGNWNTGHLWSLAVEEQFYLIWPILLCFAANGGGRKIYYFLAAPLVSAPIFRVMAYVGAFPAGLKPFFGMYSFFLHDDSLAMGCLAAVFYIKNEGFALHWLKSFGTTGLALTCLLVPCVLNKLLICGFFTVPFARTFEAAAMAVLMLQSIVSPASFGLLNWGVVRWLGVLSYSLYIWQQIFCSHPADFGFSNPWFLFFPWWLLAALLTAMVSYYFLEKPLLKLRSRLRPDKKA